MKKFVSLVLALAMLLGLNPVILPAFADGDDVYNEPYDERQIVKVYRALDLNLEDISLRGEGGLTYKEFIAKYDFTDVSNFYKKAATELAALGVSYGTGNRKFGGTRNIKNIEAVAMFLRMFGAHEAVHKKVIEENPELNFSSLTPYLYDAYVEEATNRGILPKDESLPYFKDATREDVAYWFVKTANLTNPNPRHVVEEASDVGLIKSKNYLAVETLVDLGIMTVNFGDEFGVRKPIRRQDFAKILENTVSRFQDALNLEKGYGMIIGFESKEEETGNYKDVLLRTQENTIESIRFGTLKDGRDIGFPTLNGNLIYPQQLQRGMELEYLIRDGKVILARVLNENEVKLGLVDRFSDDKDVEIIQGIVKSNILETIDTDKEKIKRHRIRVELDDDRMVDFIDEIDLIKGIDNEVLVKNGSGFIPAAALEVESPVTAYVKGDNVLFLQTGRDAIKVYKGELRSINRDSDPMTISVLDYNSNIITLSVGVDTNYAVNYYRVGIKDLKPGTPVSVVSSRGFAEFVKVESYQPPEGNITKRGKIQFAVVDSVGDYSLSLTGDVDYCEISPLTLVKKAGNTIKLSDIKPGDKVKLYYDDIYGESPSKIVVEETGALIKKLVKANVTDYNQARQQIEVSDSYVLLSTKWKPEDDYNSTYKIAYDAELYADGRLIKDLSEIKESHLGDIAYMVVRDGLNSREVSKLVFSSGYEKNMNEEIGSFDNTLDRLKLANGKLLLYGDDTIFLESDRLVSKDRLRYGLNLQVITNGAGGVDSAKVIKLLGADDSMTGKVFVGAIEDVNTYSISLKNYSKVKGADFTVRTPIPRSFNMSDDTSIFDIDKEKYISRDTFFNGDYYRKENKAPNNKGLKFKRYYGFFVTDGEDNLIAMKLRHKGLVKNDSIDDRLKKETDIGQALDDILDRMTFTRGIVGGFESRWSRVSLYDSFNFFSFNKEWKPNDKNTEISLLNALIIKDDKAIDYEDLRLDDRLFVIRDDDEGLLVLVE